jgi:hypothetical protein
MRLEPLPAAAAWQHVGARTGFEVLFATPGGLAGHTTAVEQDETWYVGYRIEVDPGWRTRRAEVTGQSATWRRSTVLERHDGDRWTVDGAPMPLLDGCVDVDLESSAVTNTLPVHRLEQTYTARGDLRFGYAAPAFDFAAELRYDESGLIVDYPGIAQRYVSR